MLRARQYSLQKIKAVHDELLRLKESDFPDDNLLELLGLFESKLLIMRESVEKLNDRSTKDVIHEVISTTNDELGAYVELMGFIIRSTNTRNSYEAYFPFLQAAKKIVGNGAKLIVSSEWEYSPYFYNIPKEYIPPDYVLIGMPVPEASNPFILSLIGHELGHAIWNKNGIGHKYMEEIQKTTHQFFLGNIEKYKEMLLFPYNPDDNGDSLDLWFAPSLSYTLQFVCRQIEELFCDIFGLLLFAESFLFSFMYFISPCNGNRSYFYPSSIDRARYLTKAVEKFSNYPILLPEGFLDSFGCEYLDPDENIRIKLSVELADEVTKALSDSVIDNAYDIFKSDGFERRNLERVECIESDIKKFIIPTKLEEKLADILAAGWRCKNSSNLWEDKENINEKNKEQILSDLIIKSIEISMIYQRIRKDDSQIN